MNWEAEKDMARDVEENSEMYQALADDPEPRYTVKVLPTDVIRVVDRRDGRLEGVWDQREKTWLDARSLIDDGRERMGP